MEKLSRAEKFKEYRSELQNNSEKGISTNELKNLQQRIIEVEKKFGNTSKTETDLNRGHKTSNGFFDAYDIFDDQSFEEPQNYEEKKEPAQVTQIAKQENKTQDEDVVLSAIENEDKVIVPTVEKIKEENVNPVSFVKETMEEKIERPTNVEEDIESALRGLLSRTLSGEDKEKNVDDYINKIKNMLSSPGEEKKEDLSKYDKMIDADEPDHPFEEVELVAPNFDEPEYTPPTKSDTDSIPSVESLIDEINTIQIQSEEIEKADEEKNTQENIEVTEEIKKPEEKEIAEFQDEKENPIFVSTLDDVVIEKPEIKPIVPQEDNSKEFGELCDNVNKLATEIESSATFAKAPYVPPRPVLPINNLSFDSLKEDVINDINSDSEMGSFMDNLKKEVNVYNQSVSNVTLDELKDNIIDEQRHNQDVEPEPKKEENAQLNKEYEATVSTEVSKLLNEINAAKADSISTEDVIKSADTVVPELIDIQQGKTIAFDAEETLEKQKENTVVLSAPPVNENADSSSIHTMSFETEELYENKEKSSTVLNVVLSILIVLAVIILGVIAYFFLLTRGII